MAVTDRWDCVACTFSNKSSKDLVQKCALCETPALLAPTPTEPTALAEPAAAAAAPALTPAANTAATAAAPSSFLSSSCVSALSASCRDDIAVAVAITPRSCNELAERAPATDATEKASAVYADLAFQIRGSQADYERIMGVPVAARAAECEAIKGESRRTECLQPGRAAGAFSPRPGAAGAAAGVAAYAHDTATLMPPRDPVLAPVVHAPAPAPAPAPAHPHLHHAPALKVHQLRMELARLGLPTAGKKGELRARLEAALAARDAARLSVRPDGLWYIREASAGGFGYESRGAEVPVMVCRGCDYGKPQSHRKVHDGIRSFCQGRVVNPDQPRFTCSRCTYAEGLAAAAAERRATEPQGVAAPAEAAAGDLSGPTLAAAAPEPAAAAAPAAVHQGICCDGCAGSAAGNAPILGVRYKSAVVPDFDLCARCEADGAGRYEATHAPFLKVNRPEQAPLQMVVVLRPPAVTPFTGGTGGAAAEAAAAAAGQAEDPLVASLLQAEVEQRKAAAAREMEARETEARHEVMEQQAAAAARSAARLNAQQEADAAAAAAAAAAQLKAEQEAAQLKALQEASAAAAAKAQLKAEQEAAAAAAREAAEQEWVRVRVQDEQEQQRTASPPAPLTPTAPPAPPAAAQQWSVQLEELGGGPWRVQLEELAAMGLRDTEETSLAALLDAYHGDMQGVLSALFA